MRVAFLHKARLRLFCAGAAALVLTGCAGDVKGVLLPVSSSASDTSKVTMLVATTRAR